jgi:hypothetical protein
MHTNSSEMFVVGEYRLQTDGVVVSATRLREISAFESFLPKAAKVLKEQADQQIEQKNAQLEKVISDEKARLRAEHLSMLQMLQHDWDSKSAALATQVSAICEAVLVDIIRTEPDPKTLNLITELIEDQFTNQAERIFIRVSPQWTDRIGEAMQQAGWLSTHYQIEPDSYLDEHVIIIADDQGGIEIDVRQMISALVLQKTDQLIEQSDLTSQGRDNLDVTEDSEHEVATVHFRSCDQPSISNIKHD